METTETQEKWLEVLPTLGATIIKPVQSSSQVQALGYNAETQKLFVVFKPNKKGQGIYSYDGATPEFFESFASAESVGKFFIANVQRALPYRRLGTIIGEEWKAEN